MTWQKLGDICEFKYGSSLPASARTGDAFPVYGSNGIIGAHNQPLTDGATIIVGRKGSIGEINFSDVPCWPIDTTYFIDRTATNADLRWLSHALSGLRLGELNKATGVPGLNRNDAYERSIYVPSLEEQKRIATILDQADELGRKRQRTLDRLNQLGQAIFAEMFGGSEVDVSIFDYLDDIQSGKNLVGVDDDNGSGFRVLKISAVSKNGFRAGETKPLPSGYVPPPSHIVTDGDLLFSRANTTELVGIPCIANGVHDNVALPDKLWRLVPSPTRAVSAFLCYALLSQSSRRQIEKMCSGTSGSMQNISIQKFKRIQVPKVSIEDQMRFQDAIEVLDSAKRDLQAHCNRTDALFQVLQHRAFHGEV